MISDPLTPPLDLPQQLRAADALLRDDRLDEAQAALAPVLAQAPHWPAAQFVQARLLLVQGDTRGAFDRLDEAAMADPTIEMAVDTWVNDRLAQCDWRHHDELVAYLRARIRAGRNICQPMTAMLITDDPAELAQCARTEAARLYPARPALWRGDARRDGRLRLAYLSSDLTDHPVGHLIAGVLEHHDRARFEVTAIFFGQGAGRPIDARLRAAVEHFIDADGLDDLAIARLLHKRGTDIAVTLNGYTTHARPNVLAYRPAPVQVSYQGFPGTMGARYIDYLIADHRTVPPGEERHYTEAVVRLPHTYQPTDDTAAIASDVPSRTDEGLPENAVVFMAYNKTCKITPGRFAAWMRLLHQVPGSVLWLMRGGDRARDNLRAAARAAGIDPERLITANFVESREAHLARHRLADLFLDTAPYNAHSTASDALWAGLPVITCSAGAFPGRVCAGLLEAANLPELVAGSEADYEALAVTLARDPARLAGLKAKVRDNAPASPLFDTARYTRELELAFQTMFDRAQAGLAPEGFDVPAGGAA